MPTNPNTTHTPSCSHAAWSQRGRQGPPQAFRTQLVLTHAYQRPDQASPVPDAGGLQHEAAPTKVLGVPGDVRGMSSDCAPPQPACCLVGPASTPANQESRLVHTGVHTTAGTRTDTCQRSTSSTRRLGNSGHCTGLQPWCPVLRAHVMAAGTHQNHTHKRSAALWHATISASSTVCQLQQCRGGISTWRHTTAVARLASCRRGAATGGAATRLPRPQGASLLGGAQPLGEHLCRKEGAAMECGAQSSRRFAKPCRPDKPQARVCASVPLQTSAPARPPAPTVVLADVLRVHHL